MSASTLKNLITHFRVLSAIQYTTSNVDVYISFKIFNNVYTATLDTPDTGTSNSVVQKEKMGFYIDTSAPHALTNVSYFDTNDQPIPTGYNPATNEVPPVRIAESYKGTEGIKNEPDPSTE